MSSNGKRHHSDEEDTPQKKGRTKSKYNYQNVYAVASTSKAFHVNNSESVDGTGKKETYFVPHDVHKTGRLVTNPFLSIYHNLMENSKKLQKEAKATSSPKKLDILHTSSYTSATPSTSKQYFDFPRPGPTKSSGDKKVSDLKISGKPLETGTKRNDIVQKHKEYVSAVLHNHELEIIPIYCDDRGNTQQHVELQTQAIKTRNTLEADEENNQSSEEIITVNDSQSQLNIAIETNEIELKTELLKDDEKQEYHLVYQKLIDTCLKIENSEDMQRIGRTKSKYNYQNVYAVASTSKAFHVNNSESVDGTGKKETYFVPHNVHKTGRLVTNPFLSGYHNLMENFKKLQKEAKATSSPKKLDILHTSSYTSATPSTSKQYFDFPRPTKSSGDKKVSDLKISDKPLETGTKRNDIEQKHKEYVSAVLHNHELEIIPIYCDDRGNTQQHVELQTQAIKTRNTLEADEENNQSSEEIITVNDSQSQLNIAIETNEMKLKTELLKDEKQEYHPVYQKFIDTCLKIENSEDMQRIVRIKIKKYYRQCPTKYVKSPKFVKMVLSAIASLEAEPGYLYKHIKKVVDELYTERMLARLQQAMDENAASGSDTKKSKNISKLQRMLTKLHKKIRALERQDVDLDDEENSAFLLAERYKSRFIKVYKMICKLTNAKMKTEPRITIEPMEGVPERLTKRLQMFINKRVPYGAPLPFPDYHDVLKCVRQANDEDGLGWPNSKIEEKAQDLFRIVGNKLKTRRQLRDREITIESRITPDCLDPAELDKTLRSKLLQNDEIARLRESDVLNSFAEIQNQQELKDQISEFLGEVKLAVNSHVEPDKVAVASDEVAVTSDEVAVTSDEVAVISDKVAVTSDEILVISDSD